LSRSRIAEIKITVHINRILHCYNQRIEVLIGAGDPTLFLSRANATQCGSGSSFKPCVQHTVSGFPKKVTIYNSFFPIENYANLNKKKSREKIAPTLKFLKSRLRT
jgi:hypothetical protein